MGKPYQKELECLPRTYAWALGVDIAPLISALTASAQKSLVAVGSGGSLSVAEFTASLHQHYADRLARAATPLEVSSAGKRLLDSSFFIFSAGGSNKDTLNVFRHLSLLEPHRLVVLTARAASPVGKLADCFPYVDKLELPLPCGKDGFLATNSLLAFCVVMARAYAMVFRSPEKIPKSLDELLEAKSGLAGFTSELGRDCRPLWKRENLVVLHSPALLSAARDLESRFTEAALGPVQIADFRHFAHGRHHWLAKRGNSTAVLSLATEADADLAAKTLGLLPREIPVLQLGFGGGPLRSTLHAICTGMVVAGLAGKTRGIDPGRPGVPPFGRKIYHLGPSAHHHEKIERIAPAVARKLESIRGTLASDSMVKIWSGHYQSFKRKLGTQTFQGLVLDYDGTICDDRLRLVGPRPAIITAVLGLLRRGIPIGIATGRGDSVRRDLRKCIPSALWRKVLVGYHNGSQLGLLSDDTQPEPTNTDKSLNDFLLTLRREAQVEEFAKCSVSACQISIRPNPTVSLEFVWSLLAEAKARMNDTGIRFVRSAHSIDVVSQGVTKLRVLDALRQTHGLDAAAPILCVGDQGRWPGNDYELLSVPHSLSVDEVSTSPETCWNLAPPGYRGSQALLAYLSAIKVRGQTFHLNQARIGDKKK